MTSDEARAYFDMRGLEYSGDLARHITYPIHWGDVIRLWCMCEDHLGDAELEMHMRKNPKIKTSVYGGLKSAFLRVDGPYFTDREAISFNEDGFIGFAGWASSENVKPFHDAFVEWVDWFVTKYGEVAHTS